MKVYLRVITILLFVVLILLTTKAYQDYSEINQKLKDIALSNSRSLSSLIILYKKSYIDILKRSAKEGIKKEYFSLSKKIADDIFKNFTDFSQSYTHIKIILAKEIKKSKLQESEKNAIEFLQSTSNKEIEYINESEFGKFLYMGKLDTYDVNGNKEKSFISILTDNRKLKKKLKNEYIIEVVGNFLFTLTLFALFYATMRESQKRDEYYLSKLKQEVAEQTRDIEEKNKKITFQLLNDDLTQMPNRSQLIIDLQENDHTDLSLALVNIDSFKEINDFYGHEIGDEVLQSFASFIKLYTENFGCKYYKLHSDEYALLWVCNDKEKIKRYIEKLTENTKNFIVITEDDYSIEITATIGLAVGIDNILSRADMVLKRAKKKQLSFLIFEDYMEIEKEYKNNITWTKKLKQAIKDDKIIPFCQPIVYTNDKKIAKYEILVRMIDEDEKIISPYHFLQIAKKNKLYSHITTSVISKTFAKFNNSAYSFSINLSILDILDEETVTFILNALNNYSNPELITFELLESEGIENYKQVLEFIDKIKHLGCKIAIDDFGSGYSNFEYMLSLKVDLIKIDASLIKNIDTNHNAQVVVSTIISFAKNLKIQTCAEFVHSKAVYDKLVELGVTYVQGYYISRPHSIDEI